MFKFFHASISMIHSPHFPNKHPSEVLTPASWMEGEWPRGGWKKLVLKLLISSGHRKQAVYLLMRVLWRLRSSWHYVMLNKVTNTGDIAHWMIYISILILNEVTWCLSFFISISGFLKIVATERGVEILIQCKLQPA